MFFIRKNFIYLIIIFFLLIILAYVANITSIPESLILFENEELNLNPIFGIKIEEAIEVGANIGGRVSSNFQPQTSKKEARYTLSLLGVNLKTITANVIPNTKVIPLGNLVGLKLYTKGVLVVGMNEIKGEDKKRYKPYEQAGIEQGDSIIQINSENVNTTEELITCVSKCKGKEIDVTYLDTSNVTNMLVMFQRCFNLTTLDSLDKKTLKILYLNLLIGFLTLFIQLINTAFYRIKF